MTFHTCAYRTSIAQNAQLNLTAVADDILNISNNRFQPPEDLGLFAAWAGGTTMSNAVVNTPSLRQICTPFIKPLTAGTVPGTNPNTMDLRANPIILPKLEEIIVSALQASAGNEIETVVLFLTNGQERLPSGNILTLQGTATTTQVAGAWTTCPMTWTDTLPNGTYSIVGMQAEAATLVAARLIVPGQVYRPGALGVASAGLRTHEMFRAGRLGVWGRFIQTAMPLVQCLSTAADTAQTVYLDIIRVGP